MNVLKAKIYGQVQDVGYRYFAKRLADKLNICGYVQNCDNGTVLVVAEAEENILEEFLSVLKKGPSFSKVLKVEVEYESELKNFRSFEMI